MATVTALTSHTFQNAATATGDGTALNTATSSELNIQVSGISGDTITFEGSLDGGTTYSSILCIPVGGGAPSVTAIANGIYRPLLPAYSFTRVRCRISTYGSGTITVNSLHG